MDKSPTLNSNTKSRKGFALIITLSVLAVIMSLTMVLLSYFDEVHQDATETKALIQADLYYTNIVNTFNKFKNKQTLFDVLYKSSLPLVSPDGKFKLMLNCQPMNKGININWLGLQSSLKEIRKYQVAQDVFSKLVQSYKIVDGTRLFEMILEEMGKSEDVYSKDNRQRLQKKKSIVSYLQFSDIISRYQFEVDDSNINAVPWKAYFSFYPKAEKINIEYSSTALISLLFDIDISIVNEWYGTIEERVPLSVMVNDNGANYKEFSSILNAKSSGATNCNINYSVAGQYYKFKFDYIEGEARYFEFF